jgi:hypothetical protein
MHASLAKLKDMIKHAFALHIHDVWRMNHMHPCKNFSTSTRGILKAKKKHAIGVKSVSTFGARYVRTALGQHALSLLEYLST